MGFNDFILNIYIHIINNQAFLVAQLVKNLPAMKETLVQILGWEDSFGTNDAKAETPVLWPTHAKS